jgi:hypothetical protein
VSGYDKKEKEMTKRQPRMTNRTRPPLEKGAHYLKKIWEPVLTLSGLKAELQRRKELSDTRSELERKLKALRS